MPKLEEALIQNLRPTQLTVGMIEVEDKTRHLASLKLEEQQNFMQAHPIPAVKGPQDALFITDHHHLGRAALEAGVKTGFFLTEADFSSSGMDEFWKQMDKNLWVHPLDQNGIRHLYSMIPEHLSELVDDVYRSVAGYVRDGGGYDKTPTAFGEFVWADFFRRSIPTELVHGDFHAAVQIAVPLARSDFAKGLPGFKPK